MHHCLYHPFQRAVGYCHVCGMFGCKNCLTEHEGAMYCSTHYRPIADKLAHDKHMEKARHRRHRQRLVARLKNGETLRGYSFHMDTSAPSFYLDLADENGTLMDNKVEVLFEDLKALFYVKSFDGHFDRKRNYLDQEPAGSDVVVCFKDGEVMRGKTLHPHGSSDANFYLVPNDSESNEITVLVIRSAVTGVYTPEAYTARQHEEREEYVRQCVAEGRQREEALGDYYFNKQDYGEAVRCYTAALRERPESHTLRKKLAATEYNRGIIHIRNHDYAHALKCMQMVLQYVPGHEKAAQKAEKLRARL
jgi:tetratricopeptide (TPR) repeat protein